MRKTILVALVSISWMVTPWAVVHPQGRFRSNGEMIYYTRTNDQGLEIAFDKGPKWLRRRRLGCVACHGSGGRGKFIIWPTLKIAPDIRYDVLVKGKHDYGGNGEGQAHKRYTDESIRRAVTQGIGVDGKSFDRVMPRWKLSGRDLGDVVDYLKLLSRGISPPPEPFPREP
ncbi:MAG: cytochrome c [Deltaproteobacteria bacterium]|nr:cytochrome c [Deltaproteobacteria bacterium]